MLAYAACRSYRQASFSRLAATCSFQRGDSCTRVRISSPRCSRTNSASRTLSFWRADRLRRNFGTRVVRSWPCIRQPKTSRAVGSRAATSGSQSRRREAATEGSSVRAARDSPKVNGSSASPKPIGSSSDWTLQVPFNCAFRHLQPRSQRKTFWGPFGVYQMVNTGTEIGLMDKILN